MHDAVLQKTFPCQVALPHSGHLLHKMSVWHTNINCSIFVLNMLQILFIVLNKICL